MSAEQVWGPGVRAAIDRYHAALKRVDPSGADGILGASVNQDARAAVDDELRAAAQALLDAGRTEGHKVSLW